jgi:GNAT superfamily N-acetyltransferase
VEIRLATLDDVPTLVALRRAFSIEGDPGATVSPTFDEECLGFLEEALDGEAWWIFVAEDGGEIVSHVYVQLVDKVPRPTRDVTQWGYVTNVYTVPGRRGTGIGSQVLAEVTEWADELGLDFLIVWPNDESRAFYERHGFAQSGAPMLRPGDLGD